MLAVNDLTVRFGSQELFTDVNLKFTPGNCYGIIGANGAGKSTFLKVLSKEIPADTGNVHISKGERLAVLKQDHFEYNDYQVLDAVIMGNDVLYKVMKEKDAIYEKEDFTDEDGVRASELEEQFAELGGWEAESQAARILKGLGVKADIHYSLVKDISDRDTVKVLLAQALFGNPDILLLDEPTNHLDILSISWLENFILELDSVVIVVSHDRHFLNKVCTHIADIDFTQIKIYVGNYDFWKESSELAIKLRQKSNDKIAEKRKELARFISRFSANASKAKQATSRSKLLEKLTLDDIKPSNRKYPHIFFDPFREPGREVLKVENLSKTIDGKKILDNISFDILPNEKVVIMGDEFAKSLLLQILAGEIEPDEGTYKWGVTIRTDSFPKDNSSYFENELNIMDWLRQYSEAQEESVMRTFTGRMLFKGDDVFKKVKVLSGGEKVRCMIAKMMIQEANALIIDGPTNHLDLESISSFNEGLIKFKGAIVLVSHDHSFIHSIINKVIELKPEGGADYYNSTFDDYLENKLKEKEKE